MIRTAGSPDLDETGTGPPGTWKCGQTTFPSRKVLEADQSLAICRGQMKKETARRSSGCQVVRDTGDTGSRTGITGVVSVPVPVKQPVFIPTGNTPMAIPHRTREQAVQKGSGLFQNWWGDMAGTISPAGGGGKVILTGHARTIMPQATSPKRMMSSREKLP